MNGLLIEDDPFKALKIQNFIAENFNNVNLVLRMSYQSGLKEIFSESFHFILLDMSIPTYDQGEGSFSGKPRNFGGRDILKEMKRHKILSQVKVITQYNDFDGGSISMAELDEQLKSKFSNLYKGYIHFASKQSNWELELKNFIFNIE